VLPAGVDRKGRFDELSLWTAQRLRTQADLFYSVDEAQNAILPILDLDRVAAAAKGFSGAEIESVVQTALYAAYRASGSYDWTIC